jgi:hypothetical protein
MAFLGQEFNSDNLPAAASYELLPEGWYSARISQSDLCMTKSGTGQYIKLRYDITGPKQAGRVVFGNLNIRNQNVTAEEIGLRDMNAIMQAIGLRSIKDNDQLIGGELQIKVAIKKDEQWGDKNEVRGYKAIEGSSKPAPFATTAPAQTAPAAQSSAPPWMARK